ncbi:hypothetical protein BDR03DRAFT_1030075 [Suillus americanus]|nr:hypothetical protein BDR03DRAFT_1030075 [Suillus americanus]
MLKTAVLYAYDDQGPLSDFLVGCEISRDTDAGQTQLIKYVTRKRASHLNHAVQHFQLVLDQRPVDHPDHAAALTNLTHAHLQGYIQNHLQDIDATTSLFCEALALRPQGCPDHVSSLYNLIIALNWRYCKESTPVYIHESAQLCCKLLPLCPEGTYLHRVGVDSAVDYVIYSLPINASDEGIHLQRNMLELCPVGQLRRPKALDKLVYALRSRSTQHGNIDDIGETIHLRREAVSLHPKGYSAHDDYLNNLALSLMSRFNHQGKPYDLNEVISLHEEVLCLCPLGHKSRDFSLGNLGAALVTCFIERGDIDHITRAISFFREALTLNNLASALETRYDKSHVREDLNEIIDRYCESLWVRRHDHPERRLILSNLSSALCSRFTQTRKNEDAEEAITLCKESLTAVCLHCTLAGISATCS